MDQEKVGKFIANIRKEKGLTQEELARKLKVSNRTISNWENGKYLPDYELLILLSKVLNVSITELINGNRNLKQEPNGTVEKVINFLRHIENERNKKYKIIGFLIVLLGITIKILSMVFIHHYSDYDTYYMILGYIISLIGFSYIYHKEKINKLIGNTIKMGIIMLCLFVFIDILDIKINNISPRYTDVGHVHYTLRYYKTPFYDVYMCVDNIVEQNKITDYEIVFKNFHLSMEELEEKYCINKNNK